MYWSLTAQLSAFCGRSYILRDGCDGEYSSGFPTAGCLDELRAERPEFSARILMAASASRALWKGAISFGLVHIPVALHSATPEQGVDFDWPDRRTMDPVGYKANQ